MTNDELLDSIERITNESVKFIVNDDPPTKEKGMRFGMEAHSKLRMMMKDTDSPLSPEQRERADALHMRQLLEVFRFDPEILNANDPT